MDLNNLNDEQIELLTSLLNKAKQNNENEEDWTSGYIRDKKGNPTNSIENYVYFLENSPKYKGQIKYNDFTQEKEIFGRPMVDFDRSIIYNDIERGIGHCMHSKADSALEEIINKNRYNPCHEYLNSLVWDGTKRVEEIFIKMLRVEDTELNREMTRKWFIAAVKRIFNPGCKFDSMIVLKGAQGIGKTSICEALALNFANTISLGELGNKDLIYKINKTWIGIIDELDTFNRKEMSSIKTWLSQSYDSMVRKFGRENEKFMRHCVFIGSTNDDTFLRDSTSSVERRFWVLKCNREKYDCSVKKYLTREYVDQIWAEAMAMYNEDPSQNLYIDNEKLQKDFLETQREFKTYTDDTVIDYIRDILDEDYMLNPNGEFANVQDFLEQYSKVNIYDNANQKINKVPMSELLFVLKSVYKETRPSKYIALALSQEWEYKNIWYKGKSYKGLYRKEQIINKNDKKDIGLPF